MTPFQPPAAGGEALLADLNPAQRAAVTHQGTPLLVVAGAGTGKTRVLTRRVGWWVQQGLPAWSILAITFTNKAAQVLRGRLEALPGARDVMAGTFHGFGAWFLRRHADAVGRDPRFTILDRDDQLRMVKTLIKDLELKDAGLRPGDVLEALSRARTERGGTSAVDLEHHGEDLQRIREGYESRLRESALMDFDDLLLVTREVLATCPEVAAQMRARFQHVLVDEYQDTNHVQRDLLLQLVGTRPAITAVGDPDQSIYAWRGAAVRNILEFEKDFPEARKVLLEQNYRSTGSILDAAEPVIAHNVGRHEKRLRTDRPTGTPVLEVRSDDGNGEADAIATLLRRWRQEVDAWSDLAVFYRVNSQSRALELALRRHQVPYVVVSGVEFFRRREVKDVLAYARLLVNPKDASAFLRAVNVPRRGVGETSLARLRLFAEAEGLTLMEAAARPDSGVRGRARKGLHAFALLMEDLGSRPTSPVRDILQDVATESGYVAMLEDAEDPLERQRVENVQELIAHAAEADKTAADAGQEHDLAAFLEDAALISDQDGYEAGDGHVQLMTVHASKGLEFPGVVVVGCETGLFPHARSVTDAEGDVEEERRLFYVAMTRAQDRLALSHAAVRSTFQGPEPRMRSFFLDEVPGGALELWDLRARRRPPGADSFGWDAPAGFDGMDDVGDHGAGVVQEVAATATASPFTVGDRVRHPHFGDGILAATSGAGANASVTVDFERAGRRRMAMRYANLERLR